MKLSPKEKRDMVRVEKDIELLYEILEVEIVTKSLMSLMCNGDRPWVDESINLFNSMWSDYRKIHYWYNEHHRFDMVRDLLKQFRKDYKGVFIHFSMLIVSKKMEEDNGHKAK